MADKLKIKGVEYTLGDVAYSEENLDFLDTMAVLVDGDGVAGAEVAAIGVKMTRGFRRLIEEALVDGCGPELAAEAMANLRFSNRPDSDMQRAIAAVAARLNGQ